MTHTPRSLVAGALAVWLAGYSTALADVKLPSIFGDHMVLQQNVKIPVWGWAAPNEAVTVTAGDSQATATAGADGKWRVKLANLKASDQPIRVTVAGKNTITFNDVLVGDVWVCSGQSNMEFNLGGPLLILSATESAAKGIPAAWTDSPASPGFGGTHDAAVEVPKANYPTLRLFIVKRKIGLEPQDDCVGAWVACTPETAARFSAVGYFFGRAILQDQHVPIGMIGPYWGGTVAQAWTSPDGLESDPAFKSLAENTKNALLHLPETRQNLETVLLPQWQKDHDTWEQEVDKPYKEAVAKWKADVAQAQAAHATPPPMPKLSSREPGKPYGPDQDQNIPAGLFNGMIAPIIPYAIKGAIWYQGESNAGNPEQYETLFPLMIRSWRNLWAEGDFPFIWVQLANIGQRPTVPTQTTDGWPGLRDAQSKTLKLPNTGQAVIIDIGEINNIHPKDKVDVGNRLALAARHVAYREDLVYSGPTFDSMTVEDGKARVKFSNIGTGLTIAAAPPIRLGIPPDPVATELKGFAIAGDDKVFHWATATIEGDSVVVSSPDVKDPKAVRYGWAENPDVNLYNKEGLPASPFRTDAWVQKTPPPPRPR